MDRKINPITGCYCTFSQRMVGDGCDLCNPELAEEMRMENEKEIAEHSVEPELQEVENESCYYQTVFA